MGVASTVGLSLGERFAVRITDHLRRGLTGEILK